MRILLDTHIFIWWDSELHRLTPSARALCEDFSNTLVLSIASVWEMQIKVQMNRMTLRLPLAQLIANQQQANRLELLPITYAHVLALDALPLHHKDPFDRLLIAQASAEGIALLTADALLSQYNVQLLG